MFLYVQITITRSHRDAKNVLLHVKHVLRLLIASVASTHIFSMKIHALSNVLMIKWPLKSMAQQNAMPVNLLAFHALGLQLHVLSVMQVVLKR